MMNSPAVDKKPSCCLIVLHYNRRDLLERFLPSVVLAARSATHPCRVVLLDNQSTDDSVAYARRHFPEIEIYVVKENRVLCSFNEYAARCAEDIVILLNNDMELDKDFVDPLLAPFRTSDDVFFVSTHGDRSIADLRWGMLSASIRYPGSEALNDTPGYTLSAGVAAFDRKKYIELGGYDDMYLPGRYEDVDLCYRGWKRGWKGIYQPQSRKMHLGGASFEKEFSDHATQALVFRNAILFMIKNVSDPALLALFFSALPVCLLWALLRGQWFIWTGLAEAVKRLPEALRKRRQVRQFFRISDRSVLDTVNAACRRLRTCQNPSKQLVNFLGAHPLAQKIFFLLGFFTLRLLFPLQYLLLRELINTSSVLDLGCGRHSMVPIVPAWIHTVGVEFYEPHYREALSKGRHKKLIHGDILKVEFPDRSFDAVALLDVIEHVPKEDGFALLQKMTRWARRKVIVFTPNGYWAQDHYDNNPLLEHRSGWTAGEFESLGFKVYGVRGFKTSHARSRSLDRPLDSLAQILTYDHPEKAFQLFCVKDLRGLSGEGKQP